jgi:hypothetical protein
MVSRARSFAAWTALMLGLAAAAPLFLFAAYHVWAGGGPPTTPERRQAHMMWEFAYLAGALAAPIAGWIAFRRLRCNTGNVAHRAHEDRNG